MAGTIDGRLDEVGLTLPTSPKLPPGLRVCVASWGIVDGFVNAEPGYAQTTLVLNPFSDVILAVFGPAIGAHARTAIGVATVPMNFPLVVSAEVELS